MRNRLKAYGYLGFFATLGYCGFRAYIAASSMLGGF